MEPDSEFKKLEKNLDGIEAFGLDQQAKSNDIVNGARLTKKTLAAFRQYINLMDKQKLDAWATAANMSCVAAQPYLVKANANLNFINAIVTTTATTGGTLFFGITDSFPPKVIKEISRGEQNLTKRLDDFLKKFCENYPDMPDLVAMRKGAWQAFNSPFATNLLSAAHNMRDILSKILRELVPQPKVSDHDRLKLIFNGHESKLKESFPNMLSVSLDSLNEKFNRLKNIAHASETDKPEVEACMIATEGLILGVLTAQEAKSEK